MFTEGGGGGGLFNSTSTYSSSCSPPSSLNTSFSEQFESQLHSNQLLQQQQQQQQNGGYDPSSPKTPSLYRPVKKTTTSSRAPKTTTFSNIDEIIHTPFTNDRKMMFHSPETSHSSSIPMSASRPTPDQEVFDVALFSDKKKKNVMNQTPRCPSPPLKSTPASRVISFNSNTPFVHHLSTTSPLVVSSTTPNNPLFSSSSSYSSSTMMDLSSDNPATTKSSNNLFSSFSSTTSNSSVNADSTVFDRNFKILKKLGSGSFSDVFQVKSRNDSKMYAIKQARHPFRGYQERDRAIQEIKNATSLSSHENIVQYFNAWEQTGILFIQTELCEKGTLKEFLDINNGQLPEEVIWNLLLDCCLAVQHIHSHNMLHLDIKPENLFISSNGRLKVGDFGMALKCESNNNNNNSNEEETTNNINDSVDTSPTNIDENETTPKQNKKSDSNNLSIDEDDLYYDFIEGDSRYLAIEFLNDKKLIGIHSDVFSIGVSFFEIVTGKEMPTNGPLWEQLRSDGALEFLEPNKYSEELYSCILSMMKSNHNQRISLIEIFQIPKIVNILIQRKINPNYNVLAEFIPKTPIHPLDRLISHEEANNSGNSPLSTMLLSASQSFLIPFSLRSSSNDLNITNHSSSNSSNNLLNNSQNNIFNNNPEFQFKSNNNSNSNNNNNNNSSNNTNGGGSGFYLRPRNSISKTTTNNNNIQQNTSNNYDSDNEGSGFYQSKSNHSSSENINKKLNFSDLQDYDIQDVDQDEEEEEECEPTPKKLISPRPMMATTMAPPPSVTKQPINRNLKPLAFPDLSSSFGGVGNGIGMNGNSSTSGQKHNILRRSIDPSLQEDLSSPRNLLSLFNETKINKTKKEENK
ncbi:putative protein tyrosine kinase [Cavenderia fasciculata]|uniref:Protein kinase domain-containing protein n=1 Tax=Cavenderia fasciculata TaxID=261658 RepID=F4PSI4_CACFS|nr:putative protein tyrosine kinase [Cavenderia fasciculata]EGG21514.1 putative protein tyrosine kinase [Cavenderia fasciculata]|eukprot:XP_004359364.1 putative protein tyrosine kinase [Cavenderia fasciculata]